MCMYSFFKTNILHIIHYSIFTIVLIILYLQGNNIIHIFTDKCAFYAFYFFDIVLSVKGILFKHKNIMKNTAYINVALIIMVIDVFIFISTSFISFNYKQALILIYLLLSIKICVLTIYNLKYDYKFNIKNIKNLKK